MFSSYDGTHIAFHRTVQNCGYYILKFDEFLKVNFRNRMLVENAISPWGQSWERVSQDCPHGKIRHLLSKSADLSKP